MCCSSPTGGSGQQQHVDVRCEVAVPVLASGSWIDRLRVKEYALGAVVPEGDVGAMASVLDAGQLQGLVSQERFGRGCTDYSG